MTRIAAMLEQDRHERLVSGLLATIDTETLFGAFPALVAGVLATIGDHDRARAMVHRMLNDFVPGDWSRPHALR